MILPTNGSDGPRGPDSVVHTWLAETGIAPRMPWGVVFTPAPITESGEAAELHLAGYYQVGRSDGLIDVIELDTPFDVPLADLGEGWRGHQFALFGLLRHVDILDAPEFTRPATTPGRAPVFRLTWLALELWRQRAYRTLADPLVAELHWWPGQEKPVPFFRPTVPPDARIPPAALTAAMACRRLLNRFERPIKTGGAPKGPRKGQIWTRRQCLEWWGSWTELDGPPTQAKLAVDMGLSKNNPEEAIRRWHSTGLQWPPTEEELDEEERE